MPALNEVVGHSKIKESLQAAMGSGRVSHAYLFGGPPGVGKKTTALAFARALLCRQDRLDACGICGDCIRSGGGGHPDLHVIRPEGAFIKINQLRAVQESAVFTPFSGEYQVYLVEQAEKMTSAAANCFLKILEEPPGKVVFILVSDDPTAILPTIISRCQCYRFHALSEQEVYAVISGLSSVDEQQSGLALKMAGGCPGQALHLISDGMGIRDNMLDLLMNLISGRSGSAFAPVDGLAEREDLIHFLNQVILFFRDILVCQETKNTAMIINIDRQEDIAQFARTYARADVLDILITAEKVSRYLASNVNHRLLLDILLYRIAGVRDEEREE